MRTKDPIVLATGNPKKVVELREIMAEIGVGIIPLTDLGMELEEPEENGSTFEENARLKAIGYARQTGRLCLADDSGLVVDSLGGAPGVISARYSNDIDPSDLPRAQRDALNNEKLLKELGDREVADRQARFVCAMCLAGPSQQQSGGGGVSPPDSQACHQGLVTRESGNLPHWRLEGSTYFVTFRVQEGELTPAEREIVADSCRHVHLNGKALIHIATVMPDHVHMLIRPLGRNELSALLHSIKSYTSHQINGARHSSGKVWQRESYDRIVRNSEEMREKHEYIELNPVRRGLVDQPGMYQWTVTGDEVGRRDAAPTDPCNVAVLAESVGTFEGGIGKRGDVPRGENGFGYDPLFLVAPEMARTSAELDSDEKHRLSHRGAASRSMMEHIRTLGLNR